MYVILSSMEVGFASSPIDHLCVRGFENFEKAQAFRTLVIGKFATLLGYCSSSYNSSPVWTQDIMNKQEVISSRRLFSSLSIWTAFWWCRTSREMLTQRDSTILWTQYSSNKEISMFLDLHTLWKRCHQRKYIVIHWCIHIFDMLFEISVVGVMQLIRRIDNLPQPNAYLSYFVVQRSMTWTGSCP